ncbi:MAG: STAS domain-containing protein [Chloroflexi bacterium]|nr:STAS domain-containing protein [Chloroflexota bacterium]
MDIKKTSNGSVQILQLKGRFDAHEVGPVKDWLKEQADSGYVRLVVNLSEVNFIDSSALSTLVQGLKHCREKGGDLMLCNLQQPVRVIFELTRLDKAFGIYPSEQAAIGIN